MLDIFSNYGLFGCFNFISGSINPPLIYQVFMRDMWILSNYLNVMLLRYDGKKLNIYFYVKYI